MNDRVSTVALLPLTLETTASGDPRRLDAGSLSLLQYPAGEASSGPAGVHLRVHTAHGPRPRPLTGPTCEGRALADGTILTVHHGLEARTRLSLVPEGDAWQWEIHLRHRGSETVEFDLLQTLDIALSEAEAIRRNEQYVAQYLDVSPLEIPADADTPATLALAVRQNMPGPTAPWAVIGADQQIAQWGTDALQLLDHRTREGLDHSRELPSQRLQHEHTLAALRTTVQSIKPGGEWSGSFWGFALEDHPEATGEQDVPLVRSMRQRIQHSRPQSKAPSDDEGLPLPVSLLAAAPLVEVQEADRAQAEVLAGGPLRLVEEDGTLLSAFADRGHLVTAAKERRVLRPHGHIQQVHAHGGADLETVASTVWMRGVFCSQLTLGHASAAPLTTVRRSYLGLDRTGGMRLLLRAPEGTWQLLSTPSLWLTEGATSHWVYLTDECTLRISSAVVLGQGVEVTLEVEGAPAHGAELLAVIGSDCERLVLDVTADGETVEVSDDAVLFSDGLTHGTGLRTARLDVTRHAQVHLRADQDAGEAVPLASAAASTEAEPSPYVPRLPLLRGGGEEVAAVGESMRWLAQNASVHFRSPRGLEQYSGGAWGTRDVCQGPVGLLLATDEPAVLRSTILTVMAAQQEDGSWPQWFDYLPGHTGPGMRDAHGDVVYWPLRALGEYLAVTGDHDLLEESAPWVGEERMGAPTTVADHVSRALNHLAAQRTQDPRLPAYGHGDWNDSLQPARPELARRMCSTWTTELEITALTTLADALAADSAARGREIEARCRALATGAHEALHEHLLVDGELAGYAILDAGRTEHLVHPRDQLTGLQHGSLQMVHALADEILPPQEAAHHLALLREHLVGPSGLHLFDRPVEYHGGEMRVFQRAEAATFWGREVGLMYMHLHLRWIEALTRLGETELLWDELLKAIPIGLDERQPAARPRQANCYYSSSDAAFPDRVTASENAEAMFTDTLEFEGGWRVYSSGPGLLLRLVVEEILGLRRRAGRLEIDPVLPAALDGIEAEIPYDGALLTVRFRRGSTGCGVRAARVEGRTLDGEALSARYREAGISVPVEQVAAGSVLEVQVG